jgi:hypothetical protein
MKVHSQKIQIQVLKNQNQQIQHITKNMNKKLRNIQAIK